MSRQADTFGAQVKVLSTYCTETDYDKLGNDLGEFCLEPRSAPLAVDFTNVHIVAMRDSDPEFRRTTDSMDIFVPDSTVLTWAVNVRGGRMKDRVYGPGFLTHMIEHTPKHLTHFFLGGSQDCLDKLIENIRRSNPELKIAGARNGYFGKDEEEDVLAEVNAANADLVWIGLGTPKQQEWIHRFKERLNSRALLAVGFAFDVNAGTKKDAPVWMQKAGLTWFYRLTQEPSRLWRRYLVFNSMFVNRLKKQVLTEGMNGLQTVVPLTSKASQAEVKMNQGKAVRESEEILVEESVEVGKLQRSNVLGVGISPVTLEEATEIIDEAASLPGKGKYVTVTGVHGVMESQRDPNLKKIHNSSFLTTPDGMPMVWMGRWNGFNQITRVYGPDLILAVAEKSAAHGRKHFFWGGKEGVASELAARLKELYPGIEIAGAVCPPFRSLTENEEQDFVAQLHKTQPHFLWVGLSTPKQENFMAQILKKYPDLTQDWPHSIVLLGVGAAFDIHTGHLAQAPRWMQKNGLEWFFRLLMEPRRLFKRYSINNSVFIWAILQQMAERKTTGSRALE